MRKIDNFVFMLTFLALFFCGCATVPTQTAQSPIWPKQTPYKTLHYVPQKMASADEAIGTIKNLQRDFVEWGAGMPFSSIDIDPYGLRTKWEWTETSQKTAYVPSYGGMFVGWNYIPIYSGSYQTQTSTQQRSDMFLTPFNEIKHLGLYHMPDLPREFKWGLVVSLEDNKSVSLRVSSENYLFKLSNAIATLAMERGVKFSKFMFGCATSELTPEQSQSLGIPPGNGMLVHGINRNSSAEKSGIQFLDVLLEFDNVPLKTPQDLIGAIQNAYNSGKKVVPVKIIRREKITQPVVAPKTQEVLRTEVIEQPVERIIEAALVY